MHNSDTLDDWLQRNYVQINFWRDKPRAPSDDKRTIWLGEDGSVGFVPKFYFVYAHLRSDSTDGLRGDNDEKYIYYPTDDGRKAALPMNTHSMATAFFYCLKRVTHAAGKSPSTLDSSRLAGRDDGKLISAIEKLLGARQRTAFYSSSANEYLLSALLLLLSYNSTPAVLPRKQAATKQSWRSRANEDVADGYRLFIYSYCLSDVIQPTNTGDMIDASLLSANPIRPLNDHKRYVYEIYGRLADMRSTTNSVDPGTRAQRSRIVLTGAPNLGKKSIISDVIHQYQFFPSRLPIFAIILPDYSFGMIIHRLARFYDIPFDPERREIDLIEHLLTAAADKAAVFFFCDIYSNDFDPVRRLAQGEDIAYLIKAILAANERSRLVCTFESIAKDGADDQILALMSRLHGIEKDDIVSIREVASIDALERFVNDKAAFETCRKSYEETQEGLWSAFRSTEVSGLWLTLAGIAVRLASRRTAEITGQIDTDQTTGITQPPPIIVEHPSTQSTDKNTEYRLADIPEIITWIIKQLDHNERAILMLLLVSGDGVRKSTLIRSAEILVARGHEITIEHIEQSTDSLLESFASLIRKREGEWPADDPPGASMRGDVLYELDAQFRHHVLPYIEKLKPPLLSVPNLVISSENRREARNRKLTGAGVHGVNLSDLQRDLRAFVNLAASIDWDGDAAVSIEQKYDGTDGLEERVFAGRANRTTIIRFLYYTLFRGEIDHENRLANWHQADELRVYLLTSLFVSPGRINWPDNSRRWPKWNVPLLHEVLDVAELREMIRSFLISYHSIGGVVTTEEIKAVEGIFAGTEFRLSAVEMSLLVRPIIDIAISQGGLLDANERPMGFKNLSGFVEEWITRLEKEQVDGETGVKGERVAAAIKLKARLAEIRHLQGDLKGALRIFEEAFQEERVGRGGGPSAFRHSALAGHGARRWVRALLNRIDEELREPGHTNDKEIDRLLEKAETTHTMSINKLFRQAGIRTSLLLDEARIEFMHGRVARVRGDVDEERKRIERAERILAVVRSKQIVNGTNVNSKVDLESLIARVGLQIIENTEDQNLIKRMLPDIKEANDELSRITTDVRRQYQRMYAELLQCRIIKIEGGPVGTNAWQERLARIKRDLNAIDIHFYDREIDDLYRVQ